MIRTLSVTAPRIALFLPETGLTEDLNDDGIVDDTDLALVIFNFGNGCH